MDEDEDDGTIGLQNLTVSQALPQGANACFDPVLQESVFECPVHGEIVLPPQVTPCLNTKAFARLKALKQLGICFLVRAALLLLPRTGNDSCARTHFVSKSITLRVQAMLQLQRASREHIHTLPQPVPFDKQLHRCRYSMQQSTRGSRTRSGWPRWRSRWRPRSASVWMSAH